MLNEGTVGKLDVDKEVEEHDSDALKEEVDTVAETAPEPGAGIPARRLS
jgi:hypothetical protein